MHCSVKPILYGPLEAPVSFSVTIETLVGLTDLILQNTLFETSTAEQVQTGGELKRFVGPGSVANVISQEPTAAPVGLPETPFVGLLKPGQAVPAVTAVVPAAARMTTGIEDGAAFLTTIVPSLMIAPATSKLAIGSVVPIPTLPN